MSIYGESYWAPKHATWAPLNQKIADAYKWAVRLEMIGRGLGSLPSIIDENDAEYIENALFDMAHFGDDELHDILNNLEDIIRKYKK